MEKLWDILQTHSPHSVSGSNEMYVDISFQQGFA